MNRKLSALVAAIAAAAVSAVQAADPPVPQNVLSLNASASIEVSQDLLSVTFTVTRDGADAGAVQAALKQALDTALTEAKKVAKPKEVEVQTGNFSLYPRYGNKGAISGWQGSTELVVEGKDMSTIAQLSGRITTMTIGRVGYGLSREAREKVEADVTAQAIAVFRAKATEMSKQFGFGGFTIREINVSTNEGGGAMPKAMMRANAAPMAAEALPVEAGKGDVTATVSGSVQMTK